MDTSDSRLVIVSNRLPVVLKKEGPRWTASSGSGGLVTALSPILRKRNGLWIGWPGVTDRAAAKIDPVLARTEEGFCYKSVALTAEELSLYYHGFSNEVLWPLFHDLQTQCNFHPDYWQAYLSVNAKFADTIQENIEEDDMLWIQDYQLMMAGRQLRDMGLDQEIAFFLHIPFPPLDLFLKLPWRMEILHGLLSYDLIGFQTQRDLHNFLHCVRSILEDVEIEAADSVHTALVHGRKVRIGAFPISIDFNEFAGTAEKPQVQERTAEIQKSMNTERIVLGVDRLDYTKGIPQRLAAFKIALERYPELRGKMSLVQVVVPSREHIPKYRQLKKEIERLVSEVNGRYTQPGWVPIHYMFRSLEREELLAYYQAADIALITPLKDGMNLVAKEYCAVNLSETGVLILSEFAGAAQQLKKGALLVNPYDVASVAGALHQAYEMELPERQRRMQDLRREIRKEDIFVWADSFVKALYVNDVAESPAVWTQDKNVPAGERLSQKPFQIAPLFGPAYHRAAQKSPS